MKCQYHIQGCNRQEFLKRGLYTKLGCPLMVIYENWEEGHL